MSSRANAFIDLSTLRHNYDVVRQLVGNDRRIIAMVKANAYGHGLVKTASALPCVDALGVADLEEALQLRHASIHAPIVVMKGFFSKEDLLLFLQYDLSPVVHHEYQLALLESTKLQEPLDIWMKIDTGMHRLGFSKEKTMEVLGRLRACATVKQPVGLMTHLADADNPDPSFTKKQLSEFSSVTKGLPGIKSIANSAAILAHQDALEDVVRPGIMLYGVSPFSNCTAREFNLKPAMQLHAKIIAVKDLKQGDRVGYGCEWVCPEDMTIGVVGIGYGDGYPRHAKAGTPVSVNGVLCPLVGRVSMDMITIDLRLQVNANIGDDVILWGSGLPIEKVAAYADTIPYELLCQLTGRVKFQYERT